MYEAKKAARALEGRGLDSMRAPLTAPAVSGTSA